MTVTPSIVSDLARPVSLQQKIQALKLLKNDVIGNEPKKEAWRNYGITRLLTDILSSASTKSSTWRGDEGKAILHAVIILGSLAHANGVDAPRTYAALIRALDAVRTNSSIALGALRALNNIASALKPLLDFDDTVDEAFASAIFFTEGLQRLKQVLTQSHGSVGRKAAELIACLLATVCRNEERRNLVASSGVLEALISQFKAIVASESVRDLWASPINEYEHTEQDMNEHSVQLTTFLKATAIIVQGSSERAQQLLTSLSAIFDSTLTQSAQTTFEPREGKLEYDFTSLGASSIRTNAADPHTRTSIYEPNHGSYLDKSRHSIGNGVEESTGISVTSSTAPVVHWLLHLAQGAAPSVRLAAIWNVVLLVRSGFFEDRVQRSILMTFIPEVVQMLNVSSDIKSPLQADKEGLTAIVTETQIFADAPRILATCMEEDSVLQETAFEAGAVPKLANLLRVSSEFTYEELPGNFWRPAKIGDSISNPSADRRTQPSRLQAPRTMHYQWNVRQSVLTAFASIASQKDEYRKSIIEHSSVPHIVDCLKPLDRTLFTENHWPPHAGCSFSEIGNPIPVLLAACEASKALCRSVGTLRTSLADANLAAPLANLLKHRNLDVQIAATAAVCNIVLEFSPMRQAAVDAGMMVTLCNNAHSSNSKLKLNSLWALKHMVHSAPNELKIECIRGLGPGWLLQTLGPFPSIKSGDSSRTTLMAFSGSESLHLYSTTEDEHEEVHMIGEPLFSPRDPVMSASSFQPGVSATDDDHRVAEQPTREPEATQIEEVAIREQGLDFVRNLIAGPRNHEMADYIVREVGQEHFVQTLSSLLSHISCEGHSPGLGCENRSNRASNDMITAVLYIICNFAGALPRHRQLLISDSRLLRSLIPLFRHPRAEIRKTCVWVIINLTWTDDQEDRLNCKSRAFEIRKIGILDELQHLRGDPDMDVRERTKTAICQLNEHLDS